MKKIHIWGRLNSINAQKVFWLCEDLHIEFDRTNAGLEFGKRLSRELHNVNLLQMPEGHDVNSIIVQEGKEWIDERIRKCLGQS